MCFRIAMLISRRHSRRLFLSDNRITDVGRGTFSAATRIGTIDLARNQLKRVDYQMFSQLNYMESINLAENNITEVQKQAFKEIYLTHINMSHNAISKFEDGAFEGCVNMTTLDLSHNRIASFSRHTFDELSYATEWLLSFNALTNLSAVRGRSGPKDKRQVYLLIAFSSSLSLASDSRCRCTT